MCVAALALLTLISHHWPFQHRDDFEAPISSEDLIIRDLTDMYLVIGMKYAGKDNSACHDVHIAILKLKTTSWEKINGEPDRLLIAFKKAQLAVDIRDSDQDFKPTLRSTIHVILAIHLAIQGIQAQGYGNCPLHCSISKYGTYF